MTLFWAHSWSWPGRTCSISSTPKTSTRWRSSWRRRSCSLANASSMLQVRLCQAWLEQTTSVLSRPKWKWKNTDSQRVVVVVVVHPAGVQDPAEAPFRPSHLTTGARRSFFCRMKHSRVVGKHEDKHALPSTSKTKGWVGLESRLWLFLVSVRQHHGETLVSVTPITVKCSRLSEWTTAMRWGSRTNDKPVTQQIIISWV